MPLIGGFSRGALVSPALSLRLLHTRLNHPHRLSRPRSPYALSNARLPHRGSKLDPRSGPRSTHKTVAPFEFRAGLEIQMKFISNRRNWRFEISIRDEQPSSTNIYESQIQNHEISLVRHFRIGTKIELDPGSELGSFDLGSGKMLVQPGISHNLNSHYTTDVTDTVEMVEEGGGRVRGLTPVKIREGEFMQRRAGDEGKASEIDATPVYERRGEEARHVTMVKIPASPGHSWSIRAPLPLSTGTNAPLLPSTTLLYGSRILKNTAAKQLHIPRNPAAHASKTLTLTKPGAQPTGNLSRNPVADQTHCPFPEFCATNQRMETPTVIEVSMKQRRNERLGEMGDPDKTRRPTALSGTIPTCKNPEIPLMCEAWGWMAGVNRNTSILRAPRCSGHIGAAHDCNRQRVKIDRSGKPLNRERAHLDSISVGNYDDAEIILETPYIHYPSSPTAKISRRWASTPDNANASRLILMWRARHYADALRPFAKITRPNCKFRSWLPAAPWVSQQTPAAHASKMALSAQESVGTTFVNQRPVTSTARIPINKRMGTPTSNVGTFDVDVKAVHDKMSTLLKSTLEKCHCLYLRIFNTRTEWHAPGKVGNDGWKIVPCVNDSMAYWMKLAAVLLCSSCDASARGEGRLHVRCSRQSMWRFWLSSCYGIVKFHRAFSSRAIQLGSVSVEQRVFIVRTCRKTVSMNNCNESLPSAVWGSETTGGKKNQRCMHIVLTPFKKRKLPRNKAFVPAVPSGKLDYKSFSDDINSYNFGGHISSQDIGDARRVIPIFMAQSLECVVLCSVACLIGNIFFKAVHNKVNTFEINLRKMILPLHAYDLTDALSDMRPGGAICYTSNVNMTEIVSFFEDNVIWKIYLATEHALILVTDVLNARNEVIIFVYTQARSAQFIVNSYYHEFEIIHISAVDQLRPNDARKRALKSPTDYQPMRVIEVSMEQQCRNERAGETGDPRENPLTGGIVRYDSHLRKSGTITKAVRRKIHRRITISSTQILKLALAFPTSFILAEPQAVTGFKWPLTENGWAQTNLDPGGNQRSLEEVWRVQQKDANKINRDLQHGISHGNHYTHKVTSICNKIKTTYSINSAMQMVEVTSQKRHCKTMSPIDSSERGRIVVLHEVGWLALSIAIGHTVTTVARIVQAWIRTDRTSRRTGTGLTRRTTDGGDHRPTLHLLVSTKSIRRCLNEARCPLRHLPFTPRYTLDGARNVNIGQRDSDALYSPTSPASVLMQMITAGFCPAAGIAMILHGLINAIRPGHQVRCDVRYDTAHISWLLKARIQQSDMPVMFCGPVSYHFCAAYPMLFYSNMMGDIYTTVNNMPQNLAHLRVQLHGKHGGMCLRKLSTTCMRERLVAQLPV
ncbi:hypothetical protein PR048_027452 [Dryococelus australis]|uniref:Uncharacterized protein n=1 Tax=Dryococelus australis TaxID=614101 RepID=A0ABQ9GFI2_9NEOP|nr:hypothetical protein PR048_027452 [Dryococelus australis]